MGGGVASWRCNTKRKCAARAASFEFITPGSADREYQSAGAAYHDHLAEWISAHVLGLQFGLTIWTAQAYVAARRRAAQRRWATGSALYALTRPRRRSWQPNRRNRPEPDGRRGSILEMPIAFKAAGGVRLRFWCGQAVRAAATTIKGGPANRLPRLEPAK